MTVNGVVFWHTAAGPALPVNGVQQQQQHLQLRAESAPQVVPQASASNGIKQPVRAESLAALESSLAQKEEEVRALRRQLDDALCTKQDADRRKAGQSLLTPAHPHLLLKHTVVQRSHVVGHHKLVQHHNTLAYTTAQQDAWNIYHVISVWICFVQPNHAELEGHALLATQELASSISGRYEQQRAAAYQRMAQLHQAAMELLASFQQQGYEVASGLDALQVCGETAQDRGG
jgi:hypothetical protein